MVLSKYSSLWKRLNLMYAFDHRLIGLYERRSSLCLNSVILVGTGKKSSNWSRAFLISFRAYLRGIILIELWFAWHLDFRSVIEWSCIQFEKKQIMEVITSAYFYQVKLTTLQFSFWQSSIRSISSMHVYYHRLCLKIWIMYEVIFLVSYRLRFLCPPVEEWRLFLYRTIHTSFYDRFQLFFRFKEELRHLFAGLDCFFERKSRER